MRLRHRVTLAGSGATVDPLPAYVGHRGASTVNVETGRVGIESSAVALVDLPDELVELVTAQPDGYELTHKGIVWDVTGAHPHYRPDGRTHHTTLELRRRTG